jgi:ATP-dependent Clp protease ATP-binding subunit ClpA
LADPLVGCTARVRDAFLLARAEAQRLGATTMAPSHLLLGLAWERDGVAARALRSLGVDPLRLRRALAAGPTAAPQPPPAAPGVWQRLQARLARPPAVDRRRPLADADLSAAVADLLRRARAKADQRDRSGVDQMLATEHILLELVQEPNEATALLEALGARPEAVRGAVFHVLDQASRGGRV